MTRARGDGFRADMVLVVASMIAGAALSRHLSQTALHPGQHVVVHVESPAQSWKEILFRTWSQIDEDRLLATAGGVVFFGLLATFPAITALVSSYGLFADPLTIAGHLQSLAVMLPAGSFAIVQDQIDRVVSHGSSLSIAFVISLMLALWSANAGMKAVIEALNVVYDAKEQRNFFRLNLVSLTLTVAGLGAVLIMVSAVVALPLMLGRLGLDGYSETLVSWGRWPIMAVLLMAGLSILFRFAPYRPGARLKLIGAGNVSAALLWLLGSAVFSWYLSNFGEYNATYGSLGAAIGLMMWMWMSAIVVLCGAELDAEVVKAQASPGDKL